MLMKSKLLAPSRTFHQLTKPVSSPADIIWSSLLLDKPALNTFIKENRARLAEAHAFTRGWFEARGVGVAVSNAGHFIWVDLGSRLGMGDGEEGVKREKKVFQELLDGGVYIVRPALLLDSPPILIDES